MMEGTVWEIIADALLEEGFEVYPPATKNGECTSNYIVIKEDGSSQIQNFSSEYEYYNLMLYVPQNKYTELSKFKMRVKDTLYKKLFPMIMYTGSSNSSYFDESIKAHMVSLMYRNAIRNKSI